jgi:hypothetical protein
LRIHALEGYDATGGGDRVEQRWEDARLLSERPLGGHGVSTASRRNDFFAITQRLGEPLTDPAIRSMDIRGVVRPADRPKPRCQESREDMIAPSAVDIFGLGEGLEHPLDVRSAVC